jgi:hypothetical protein
LREAVWFLQKGVLSMCCSGKSSSGFLFFTPKQAEAFVDASKSIGGKYGGLLKSRAADVVLVAASTPAGDATLLALVPVTDNAGFYTEAGGYQIAGEFERTGGQLVASVGVFKSGAIVRELSWTVELPKATSISKTGVLTALKVVDHEGISPLGCFEDCIRRHAPNCIAVCDWTGWGSTACWACAAAAAACCAINCHC